VRYCDAECQRAAWAGHRPACKAAAAQRAALVADTASSSAALPGGAPSATLAAQREEVETWRRMPLDTVRQAAEGGVAAAQGALGAAYLDGSLGLTKDINAGCVWLRKAAAQGLLPARAYLGGVALSEADDPGADAAALLAEARKWYRPVAEAGDAVAQNNMFVCCARDADLRGGTETAALDAEAGRWLRAAAAQGQANALNALGVNAWDGFPALGVARDRAEATQLFAAADAAGVAEALRARRPAGAPGSSERA
jgi:TPR repeat protein